MMEVARDEKMNLNDVTSLIRNGKGLIRGLKRTAGPCAA